MSDTIKRCTWATSDPIYARYHDKEWGIPLHDDQRLFEFLVLEGMQAGLSWLTILKKRVAFRAAFDNFEVQKVALYDLIKQDELMANAGIIRNRLKIKSAVQNAIGFLAIQREFGSFDDYIWGYTAMDPARDNHKHKEDLAAQISQDLKKRGFNFVGPTIVYAFLQAIGIFDDHDEACYKHARFQYLDTRI